VWYYRVNKVEKHFEKLEIRFSQVQRKHVSPLHVDSVTHSKQGCQYKKTQENNKVNVLEHDTEEGIWAQTYVRVGSQQVLPNEEFHDLYSLSDM